MTDRQGMVTRDDALLLSALVAHAEQRATGASMDTDDRVSSPAATMNTTVEYEDIDTGQRARVQLVHPSQTDAAQGRISVLSPVGRALLGRRPGHVSELTLPSGDVRSLMIVEVGEESLQP